VHGQWKHVPDVGEEHDDVRRPARREGNEYYEDHLHLAYGFDDRRLRRRNAATSGSDAGLHHLQDSLLGLLDVGEDTPVAYGDNGQRQQHADADEEHRVAVRCRPVPQTLLRLAVERVNGPPDVAGQIECHANQPGARDYDKAVASREQRGVALMVTYEDVSIDADAADTQQRHHATCDAQTCEERAEPFPVVRLEERWSDYDACSSITEITRPL